MRPVHKSDSARIELSFVIPVYNGSRSIAKLVDKIHHVFLAWDFEILLVNDGSTDSSEDVCFQLASQYPTTVVLVNLSRNFGEHNSVLAGLTYSNGEYVAVLDDDGQHRPEDVLEMLIEIKARHWDVIYGRYRIKRHSQFRNIGSWFNDKMATLMLKKPADIYLSSFKIMNRFIVNEVIKYKGPFPYIDGLIYRVTKNLGQIQVEHEMAVSKSRYTVRKLMALWFNMFLSFSIGPLRMASVVGAFTSMLSVILIGLVIIDKLFISRQVTLGIPSVLVTIFFFSGIQMMILGIVGEYLGRLFLEGTGSPQFVVRYIKSGQVEEHNPLTLANSKLPYSPSFVAK
jgi:glycosyltransferase involved in cell wall biosynthesis